MSSAKCPRCNGVGTTYRPPWVPGDQATWVATGAGQVYACSLCGGAELSATDIVGSPDPTTDDPIGAARSARP